MALLTCSDVTFSYEGIPVLTDVNFALEAGSYLCIVGENGSGKSTFLRCINQLESPSGGIVEYEGKNLLDKKCDIRKFREEVGMVFQRFNLFPLKTVAENVMMAPVLTKHMNKEEAHEKALELLDKVGLKDKADVYPSTLSGGQQQRAALARAIVTEPKVLLLDEPLSAIDALLRKSLQAEIRRIQKELNITAIFVTHDQEEAMVMSDEIHLLYEGKIEQSAKPVELYQNPATSFAASFIGNYNLLTNEQFHNLSLIHI